MPKSLVTRKQADQLGRWALAVITGSGRLVTGVARFGARAVRQIWHVVQAVPASLQLFAGASVFMLFGIVGAITLHTTLGLVCIVVVIPACAGILGALGYRWYSGLDTRASAPASQPATTRTAEPTPSDLLRSVQYVDKKLALALVSFGTEHHQQAVIALFQAKTAAELTLGTEQDAATYGDVSLRADDYGLRPRIRVGTGPDNSLAAS